MKIFGLIGYPLSHSFSEKYFTEKFRKEKITNCQFKNFPLKSIVEFPALLQDHPTIAGLSVTIPYKIKIMNYLTHISPEAKRIGAVNCIKINRKNKKLTGYNTDCTGFEKSLKPLLKREYQHALILGTGGAARAVSYVLDKSKISFRFVSRKKDTSSSYQHSLSYSEINYKILAKYLLIINTTPLGMFPHVNDCPDIPYHFLSPQHLLFDLVYNPEETLFLKKGKEQGAQIKNGLEMLHCQAEDAWQIWNS